MRVLFNRFFLLFKIGCIVILFLIFSIAPAVAQQWTQVSAVTDSTLNGVYFTDRNMGWAVGDGGTIIHTSDGGDTWNVQDGRTSEQLNSVYFFDEFTGWIAANNNLVLYTENGGERWTERRPSSVSGQHITDISFSDWKRGWAVSGPGGHIYFTDNSGLTWQRRTSISPDGIITAIQSQDHQTAYAIYGNQFYVIHGTNDESGESHPLFESGSFKAEDIYVANDTLSWVIGNDQTEGVVLHTVDGGKQWNEIERIGNRQFRSVIFTDENNGFIAGTNGTILRTENGGQSWEVIESETDETLNDISFADPGNGWIVGEEGSIYRLLTSEKPDISYYKSHYPSIQIFDENEALNLLQRGQQYGDAAQEQKDPKLRAPHYGRLIAAMDEVEEYFGNNKNEYSSQIPLILNHFWSVEHNEGANLFNESLEQDNNPGQIEKAKDHLQNATYIQPDSIHSYVSLAYINNRLNNVPEAISAMEKAISKMDVPDVEHYAFLINHYHAQKELSKGIELNKKGVEHYPEEQQLYETMVNLYLDQGDIEEAISYLNILIEKTSENPSYYLVRGAQLQYIALNKLEDALRLYEEVWALREELETDPPPSEKNEIENRIRTLLQEVHKMENEGTEYAHKAISDMEKLVELEANTYEAHGIIGSIHHNIASIKYQIRTLTADQAEAQQFDSTITTNLEEARDHYERAVTFNPDESSYWEALYYIYLDLGMEAQAEQIVRNEHFEN